MVARTGMQRMEEDGQPGNIRSSRGKDVWMCVCAQESLYSSMWRGRGYVDRRGIRRCTSNMCNRRDARDIDMRIWDDNVQKKKKNPPCRAQSIKGQVCNGNIRGRQVSAWHWITSRHPPSLEGEYRPELRVPLSGNAATTAAIPTPEQTALQRQNRPQAIISTAAARMPLQEPAALV